MAQKQGGRVVFADLLRVFALLAAMILYLIGDQLNRVGAGTASWTVLSLYDGLLRWCVPVFAMLSGMMMLDEKAGRSLPKLFFHNALRVLIALLVWAGIYAAAGTLAAGGRFTWAGLWADILSALRGNSHDHLWFLYIILGLYLVTPVLRSFVRGASRSDFRYFFVLAFLFASLLPMSFRLWPGTAVLQVWYDRLAVQLVLGYVGYYVAGYYLREYTISRIAEAVVYVLGVLGAAATVWGTSVLSRQAGRMVDTLYDPFSPNIVCFSVAVVVLFRYVLGVSDERSRRQRLSGVARISFGMYLVHPLFLMLLDRFGITVLSFPPAAAVPLLAAAVFLCSFASAWLISKIPFIGWWLT